MPYFVYRIHGERTLERIASFDAYRDARARVRALRAEGSAGGPGTVRMIFAADPSQAERLLQEKREPRPLGEEG